MSSSLRNAITRRNHRERSQPSFRSKYGLLEKRKDYQLRAQDYKAKQQRLKQLYRAAESRNENEFYFGMIKEKTKQGIVIQDRGNKPLTNDELKLLRTQDFRYLRHLIQIETHQIDLLKSLMHDSSLISNKDHMKFDEDGSETKVVKKSEEDVDLHSSEGIMRRLEAHQDRLLKLQGLEKECQLQRQLQKKGPRRKIGVDEDGHPIYKLKTCRKK